MRISVVATLALRLGIRDIAVEINKSASAIRGQAERLKVILVSDGNEVTRLGQLVELGPKWTRKFAVA